MSRLQELLDSIVALFNKYVVLPDYGPETISLYILSTYLVDIAQFAPILILRSPEMRCGKTTTLDLIGELVREPLAAANASPAAIFRSLEEYKPTLLLDEVDSFLATKSETSEAVRGILNAGHRRGRYSTVMRSSDRGELHKFDVFGFKVLSGIGKVHATLRDRSITLPLRRKLPTERVERLRIARMTQDFASLRTECEEVAEDITDAIALAYPEAPAALSDRAADNWELLLAIADEAGGPWPECAREAAVSLETENSEDSDRVTLLSDIRDYFAETRQPVAATKDLLFHLNEMETRPWVTWNKGRPLSAHALAKELSGFGISPRQFKLNGKKSRGYAFADMTDSFQRYLAAKGANGTPVPEEDISLHDRQLTEYPKKNAYRYLRGFGQEETGTIEYRSSNRDRYPDKSFSDIDVAAHRTGVPEDDGGSYQEDADSVVQTAGHAGRDHCRSSRVSSWQAQSLQQALKNMKMMGG